MTSSIDLEQHEVVFESSEEQHFFAALRLTVLLLNNINIPFYKMNLDNETDFNKKKNYVNISI